jgi:hypothetical protein
MEPGKISPSLAEQLKESPRNNCLDVIVEFVKHDVLEAASSNRAAKLEARKQAFERLAEPVVDLIHSLGGEVTGKAWINGSLQARLDQNMISALSTERNISRLDLPHPLKADVSDVRDTKPLP